MNKTILTGVIATAICHTVMLDAIAAAESLADCRGIDIDAERLACYDRVSGGNGRATASPDIEPPTTESNPARRVVAAPPVTTTSPDARDVTSNERTATSAERGAPDRKRAAAADTDDESERIRARVTGVSERPLGEHVIILDNGQVWQQPFASRYFPVSPGDEIVIRKQFFGGYRLVTESGKGYRVERVR